MISGTTCAPIQHSRYIGGEPDAAALQCNREVSHESGRPIRCRPRVRGPSPRRRGSQGPSRARASVSRCLFSNAISLPLSATAAWSGWTPTAATPFSRGCDNSIVEPADSAVRNVDTLRSVCRSRHRCRDGTVLLQDARRNRRRGRSMIPPVFAPATLSQ